MIILEIQNPISLENFEIHNPDFEWILLFLSVANSNWLDWFHCEVKSKENTLIQEHFQPPKRKEQNFRENLIYFDQYQRLIENGLNSIVKNDEENQKKLRILIEWYIECFSGNIVEISFQKACTSLELAKTIEKNNQQRESKIIPSGDWKRIRKAGIYPNLEKEVLTPMQLSNLKQGISNANRKSFATLIKEFCFQFQIPFNDLYPETIRARSFSFISMRNDLIHKGFVPETEINEIWNEYYKLMAFIERIILILLDYKGFYCDKFNKNKVKNFKEQMDSLLSD